MPVMWGLNSVGKHYMVWAPRRVTTWCKDHMEWGPYGVRGAMGSMIWRSSGTTSVECGHRTGLR